MPRMAVLISPRESSETRFSALAAKELFESFGGKTVDTLWLDGRQARRKDLKTVMEVAQSYAGDSRILVCYFGHGVDDALMGTNRLPKVYPLNMIVGGVNDDILAKPNVITYTIACSSLRKLGRSVIQNGGLTYFGSTEDIMLVREDIDETQIPDIIETWMQIPISLARGRTTRQALNDYRAKLKSLMTVYDKQTTKAWKLSSTDESLGQEKAVKFLSRNLEFYNLLGKDVKWI